jgi:hypothetical protein
LNEEQPHNSKTTIGCFAETATVFNELKEDISGEIKQFITSRLHKQDITLQCFIRCWMKSAQETKDSIILDIIKELKAND